MFCICKNCKRNLTAPGANWYELATYKNCMMSLSALESTLFVICSCTNFKRTLIMITTVVRVVRRVCGGWGRVPDAVCVDLSFYEDFNSPGLLNGVQKSF